MTSLNRLVPVQPPVPGNGSLAHAADPPLSSAPKRLEELVRQAEAAGASDVHLQMAGDTAEVAFRLDGVMTPVSTVPAPVAERLFGRIKFLAGLKTYQESLPQDGRINQAELGARHDVRVATYPTVTGEKIVLRLFQRAGAAGLREIGLPDAAADELERFLRLGAGLLLLTGPAGSGKTTTIYGCLQFLRALGGRHIITVEDPVEQILPGIMQTEVNEARGLTFAVAARHLLRQDPQALVLGEIRDEQTARLALRAALTGHLMIATLHAGSCRGVWERLLALGADAAAAASVPLLIWNQRLLRRRCAGCGGAGCADCLGTGYRGRVPVAEWCRVDDATRRQLREQGGGMPEPVVPLRAAARALADQGVTEARELERVFGDA
jgi:type II secretory ATPase GspE/PulE/Tfp pilus assembly ATPase PilB-like protein